MSQHVRDKLDRIAMRCFSSQSWPGIRRVCSRLALIVAVSSGLTAIGTLGVSVSSTLRSPWTFVALEKGRVFLLRCTKPEIAINKSLIGSYPSSLRFSIEPIQSAAELWSPPEIHTHRSLGLLYLSFPVWELGAIIVVALPICCWRAGRIIPEQCCRTCRYDLSGNVTGTCPECGTPTPKPEPPAANSEPRT